MLSHGEKSCKPTHYILVNFKLFSRSFNNCHMTADLKFLNPTKKIGNYKNKERAHILPH